MSNLGISKWHKYKMKELVQLKNSVTDHYVLINIKTGGVMSYKKSKGPYKNIKMVVSKIEVEK